MPFRIIFKAVIFINWTAICRKNREREPIYGAPKGSNTVI